MAVPPDFSNALRRSWHNQRNFDFEKIGSGSRGVSTPRRSTRWRLFWDAYMCAAILLWAIFLCSICVMVYRAPDSHTVTPVYRWAVHAWFAGEPLRNAAWHYFPQFVFFFMPFYALPQP